jgi:hypothetical protein
MSTAISPGLGLPDAPARLLPRRIGARRGAEEGKGAGAFRTPPRWGRQPPKAPIWEAAAFFSTAGSAEAS